MIKPGELIIVDWVDSHSDGAWQGRSDALRMACQTVGFVLEETDTWLLVAGSQTGAREQCVAGTMMIPQIAITGVKRLQVGRAVAR